MSLKLLFLLSLLPMTAKSDLISGDVISLGAAAWVKVNEVLGRATCTSASCSNQYRNNSLNDLKACVTTAQASDAFAEAAKDQQAELSCDFDYLGKYDLHGTSRSCSDFREQASLKDSVAIALTPRPLRRNSGVFSLQHYAVNRILDDAKAICEAKQSTDQEIKKTASVLAAQTWNADNPHAQSYLASLLRQVGSDCRKLEARAEFREKFQEMALNPGSARSFQQMVIDRGRRDICQTLDSLKRIESNPQIIEGKDRLGQNRNMRAYLASVVQYKIVTDTNFANKYGHLQCQLSTEFGEVAKNIETGGRATSFVVGLAMPVVIRLMGRVALSRMAASTATSLARVEMARKVELVAGFLSASGVALDMALTGLSECGGGAPEHSRHNICANKSMADLPPQSLVKTEFQELNTNSCLVGASIAMANLGSLGTSALQLDRIRRLGLSPRDLEKKYKIFTEIGKAENADFLKAREAYKGQVTHYVFDNIVLKELNDKALGSKLQGTVVTNLQKSEIVRGIRQRPAVDQHVVGAYSDWKGIEAITLNGNPETRKQMAEMFEDVQFRYGNMFNHPAYQDMLNNPELRSMVRSPTNWFRAGSGPTSAKANAAARAARALDGAAYEIIDYYDPRVQKILSESFQKIKSNLQSLNTSRYGNWVENGLLVKTKDGNVPSVGLAAIFRQQLNSSRDLPQIKRHIAENIRAQFPGTQVTDADIDLITDIFRNSERFMGKVYVTDRTTWDLADASKGFILSDREAFDARNMNSLFSELASSRSVDDAVERSEMAIDNVTNALVGENKALRSFQESRADEFVPLKLTGDESVLLPDPQRGKPVTVDTLIAYVKEIPTGIRSVAVSPTDTLGRSFNTRNFDKVAVKAEELQKQLAIRLSNTVGLAERAKVKLGAFVTPASQYASDQPLRGSDVSLIISSEGKLSQQTLRAIERISRELSTEYQVRNLSVRNH